MPSLSAYWPVSLFAFCLLTSSVVRSQNKLTDEEVIKYFESKKAVTVYYSNVVTQAEHDRNFSRLVTGIIELNPDSSSWATYKVKEAENLSTIVNRLYGYYDSEYGNTSGRIVGYVTRSNNLLDKDMIKVGQELKVPNVPTRAYLSSDRWKDDVGQYLDLEGNKKMAFSYSDYLQTGEIQELSSDVRSSSFTAIDLPLESASSFLRDYSYSFLKANLAFVEPPIEVCPIESDELPSDQNEYPRIEKITPQTLQEIAKIKPEKVDSFFVFDSFKYKQNGESCTHGERVMAIIYELLDQFGIPVLKSKVKKVPIDFFESKKTAMAIIKTYLTEKGKNLEIKEQVERRLQYYGAISKGNCLENCAPSDFLNILLDYYMEKKPEVISMSFYMKPLAPILNFQTTSRMNTNLVCAALNLRSSIEETLDDPENTLAGRKYEPLFTVKTILPETGGLIVGAENTLGTYSCLFSSDGTNVTAIGKGRWQEDFVCNPRDYGSSYAAPEVATKLFIAKAYWKSLELDVNAFEARTRLLFASTLDSSFVGKFSSGGKIDINKLLIAQGGFLVRNDSVIHINAAIPTAKGKIIVEDDFGIPQTLTFGRTKLDNYFNGIALQRNTLFVFIEKKMKWVAVRRITEISISITEKKTNKRIEIKSIGDLKKQHINQIVTL